MKLLTKEIKKNLPALYTTDGQGDEAMAIVKFFSPDANFTWYATEFDGKDTFFGYVKGFEGELAYFSLSELESVRGKLGLKVERDMYFSKKALKEIK